VVEATPDIVVPFTPADWFCGDGWLGYRLTASPPRLEHVAAFRPKGLIGLTYWWALWPVHWVVFRVMHRGRIRRARIPADSGITRRDRSSDRVAARGTRPTPSSRMDSGLPPRLGP